jgi:hypothetical protein
MNEEAPVLDNPDEKGEGTDDEHDKAPTTPKKHKQPLSQVRHLGPVEVVDFANGLRDTPGKDLGADAARIARLTLLESRRARVTPKRQSRKKDTATTSNDDEISQAELLAKEQADMEVARLEKVLQGLKSQQETLQKSLIESNDNNDKVIRENKKLLHGEEELTQELNELLEENADLTKDLNRHQERIDEDKIIMTKFRAKIDNINKQLAEATSKERGGGLQAIHIKFGPTSPKLRPEIDAHDGEVVWFETIQLPNAMKFQAKLKADMDLKTGGRSNRRERSSTGSSQITRSPSGSSHHAWGEDE